MSRLALALLVAGAAFAGCSSGNPPARQAGTDRWTPLSPATLERTEVAAARVGRFVYVMGGFERKSAATTRAVERYDLRRDRWKRVRSMPIGLNHATAVAYRGRLYVHGGYRGRRDLSSATSRLYRYSPRRNRWTRLPDSPSPRAAHAAAVIGHRLYVAGGANASGSLRSLEVYNFRSRRWRRGPSFRGPARNHTTGVASGGRFYVLAGRDVRNLRSVDRYNPRRRRWTRLRPMRTARGGIASARLPDGRIVVFGGEQLGLGGTTIKQVEVYSPKRNRWRRLPDMRTPRHGLGGVSSGDRVYAIEGGPQPGFHFSDLIETLDVR
jgi:N-acetylneuraminic acid mutarotase